MCDDDVMNNYNFVNDNNIISDENVMSNNKIMCDNDTIINRAAQRIREGDVVAFPTETVYGLGANALDEKACAKIFEIKRRPSFDPLIVHIAQQEKLYDLVINVPPLAKKLADKFWPGPLTLVLPKKNIVPDIVTAGLAGVAVRMPKNEIALRLITLADVPVAAPSANLFGKVSPTTAQHVREQLGDMVDIIIDGGACDVGVESTIISFMNDTPMLLRPGGVPLEDIEKVIGKIEIPERDKLLHQSPGRCESHYAPNAKVFLIESIDDICKIDFGMISENANRVKNIGLLAFGLVDEKMLSKLSNNINITHIENLSTNSDVREAACNLFAMLRRLDSADDVDVIAAIFVPNIGLGLAINDRLFRAGIKSI